MCCNFTVVGVKFHTRAVSLQFSGFLVDHATFLLAELWLQNIRKDLTYRGRYFEDPYLEGGGWSAQ